MADTRTRPGTDRRPLISYLRIQRDREREMVAILRRSSLTIDAELKRLAAQDTIGAAVRREQLARTQAAIHRELGALWRQLGLVVLAGREDAIAAAVESVLDPKLLRAVMAAGDAEILLRSAAAQAQRGIGVVEARLTSSKRTLSERVYRSQDLVDGKIDDIVDSALARGASARELALDVRKFIRPDVKGGVRYAATRLGRTELNNAFHAGQVLSGVRTPWVTALKWNLSGSHPKPDECNEYADDDHDGLGAGLWKPGNVPGKPHPNCLCFTTSETVDRDTFVAQFNAGRYDGFVDELTRTGSVTFR